MEDWAEIRRLHRAEGMAIKAIARHLGVARNTVRAALAADGPPRYERARGGSAVDEFEPAIRELLAQFPKMPATVIAERVGWTRSASVFRARVAELRPLYAPADPADRTVYQPAEIVQCDLWFPPPVVPTGSGAGLVSFPVLSMVAAWSGFMAAVMLPSRQTPDLLGGMWQLLSTRFDGVSKVLVWDNEAGIGKSRKLTVAARAFAGTLGCRIYQTAPYDPEAKGIVERANQYQRTSFLPGRRFTSPHDFNTQLKDWCDQVANQRRLRRTGEVTAQRYLQEQPMMMPLPPVPPATGHHNRVRLGRDYYLRIAGNDYSVDPAMIGRMIDIRASLDTVTAMWEDKQVASHARYWGTQATITDTAHQQAACELRKRFREPQPRLTDQLVPQASLADYDALFAEAV